MRSRFRSVLIAVIGILLIAAPAFAGPSAGGQAERPDPRAQVENVDVVVDPDGNIWVKLQFAEPWAEEPPQDLFSFFFQLFIQHPEFFLGFGWQIHDGEIQPFGSDASGPLEPEMYILADGCVLIATGLTTDDEVPGIQGGVESGSWVDEDTTEAVFESFQIDIPPQEFIEGDPFELFGPPVYDLGLGEPVAVATTTTSTTTPAAVSQPETTTTTTPVTTTGTTPGRTTERTPGTTTSETCWSCWTVVFVLFFTLLCVVYFWMKRYEWWSCWLPWFFVIWVWAPVVLVWLAFFGPGVWWWWIPLLAWFPAILWGWRWARRRSWWLSWMNWLPLGWIVVLAVGISVWQPAWWWLLPLFWLPGVAFYLWYGPLRVAWWRPWMWYGAGAWVVWFFVWAIWLGAGWVWWFPVVFFPLLVWWIIWQKSTRTWAYWGPKLCWLLPWVFLPFFGWWIFTWDWWWCLLLVLILFVHLLCVVYHWMKRYEWWSCWLPWFFVIWVWAPVVLVWLAFFGPGVWWWWIPLLAWFPAILWGWRWARRRSWWLSWMNWLPLGWIVVLAVGISVWQPAWWWLLPLFWLPGVAFYLWYRPNRVPWWRPWMWYGFGAWTGWFFVWAIWAGAGWVWWFPVVFFPFLGWWIWRSGTRTWAYWGPKLCWLLPWVFLPLLAWWVLVECYTLLG